MTPRAFAGGSPATRLPAVATGVSTGAVVLVLAVQCAAPGLWHRWSVPVFVAGVVAGIPHGAVDHLVPGWFRGTPSAGRDGAVPLGYALTAAGAFTVCWWAPTFALCAFLAASAAHFGHGEVRFDALRRAGPDADGRTLATAHGAVTVVLPLTLWPEQVRPVVRLLAPEAERLLTTAARPVAAVLAGVCVLAGCTVALLRARFRQVAELLLLTALFTLVPPLAAFGTYFGAWHSVRHIARLVLTDPANAEPLRSGPTGAVLRRFCRQAAAPTLVTLAVLALLSRAAAPDGPAVTATGVALLAALTLPHLLVVARLDRHAPGETPGPAGNPRKRPGRHDRPDRSRVCRPGRADDRA
ncbi:Brp/Blh family beta-carotene 15,15'-dioxygenase [Streptomyces sp. NPDC085946]|uniref:Brp/Blh family beta-carotene 15,15'-dioxygenase n=1 Tax=Streptomyces sp. NPDC085946 TaxID=3365744 RepID=UPI0037CD0E6C